jgi:hypothetical protein
MVTLFDVDYVLVNRSKGDPMCMLDRCPHRCAQLSIPAGVLQALAIGDVPLVGRQVCSMRHLIKPLVDPVRCVSSDLNVALSQLQAVERSFQTRAAAQSSTHVSCTAA